MYCAFRTQNDLSEHSTQIFNIRDVIDKKRVLPWDNKQNKMRIINGDAGNSKLQLASQQNVNNSKGIAKETGRPTLHRI